MKFQLCSDQYLFHRKSDARMPKYFGILSIGNKKYADPMGTFSEILTLEHNIHTSENVSHKIFNLSILLKVFIDNFSQIEISITFNNSIDPDLLGIVLVHFCPHFKILTLFLASLVH